MHRYQAQLVIGTYPIFLHFYILIFGETYTFRLSLMKLRITHTPIEKPFDQGNPDRRFIHKIFSVSGEVWQIGSSLEFVCEFQETRSAEL